MRLSPGIAAPHLKTVDFLGNPVDLETHRGRPVLLSFYRYASCPLCNMRVRDLIVANASLSDAGLAMIAVFQSSAASIATYVGKQDAPFPIVADPEMVLYQRYGLESRWLGLGSVKVVSRAIQAFVTGFLPGKIEGPVNRVPADFLIDQYGRIDIAYYGRDIDDHMPIDKIEAWLSSQRRTVQP
jgi:thioredoxin-dependent peroxiredoxin